MADTQILKNIESKILAFQSGNLKQNTLNLFSTLGYESPHQMDIFENTPDGFLEYLKDNSRTINQNQAYFSEWKKVDFCLQLTNEDSGLFDSQVNNFDKIINTYLLFCIELKNKHYPNRVLADITRAMNRVFPKPVFVLFKHGSSLTLSIINRRKHKKDSSKEVLEKITLIKDIDVAEPHRAHKEILFDLSLFELRRNFTIHNFDDLHSAWQSVLNISELNKKFYREISNWYFWARENVEFPNKPVKLKTENETDYHERVLSFNSMNLIRLITRLIFVWFLKEKGLIPDILFSEKNLKDLLLFNDSNKSTYYKAILQNLFFATLNQEMNTPQKPDNRKFRHEKQHYNITNLYRYKSYFKDEKKALEIFAETPFLNGGLFECLDKRVKNESGEEETIRIDGFSDRTDNPLKVPDELFFSEQFNIDLSKVYESKNKNDKVRGIINILNNYKFTIAENTPVEEEVALDPELLGKVFENLLASYNPETGTTARKQTGSFYTPREIVNYMVDESLIAYIDTRLKDNNITTIDETKLRLLLSYSEDIPAFSSSESDAILEALDSSKILDPACGSGAFPMGILHKMVHIIHKLDPNNEKWKKRQIENQTKEIKQDIDYAERIKDDVARENALAELNEKLKNINDIFDNNELDYGRKLFLIENCIYGIDIQPIAVQIAKLRFFISLIVEQKVNRAKYNSGIIPLPNLETKFVAANTLIGIEKPELSLFRLEIDKKEKELEEIRQKYFTARTPATKLKYRDEDEKKRKEIEAIFQDAGMKAEKASQLAKWNPYDQSASAGWFDSEFMFGIKDGFDVVIGNPPYGFRNVLSKEEKDYFRKIQKIVFSSGDSAELFCKISFNQLIKENGVLTFIIPKKSLYGDAWEDIRVNYWKKYDLAFILDTGKSFDNVLLEASVFGLIKSNTNRKVDLAFLENDLSIQRFSKTEKKYIILENNTCQIYKVLYPKSLFDKIRKKSYDTKKIKTQLGLAIGQDYFSDKETKYKLLKGIDIEKYKIRSNRYLKNYTKLKLENIQAFLKPKIISQRIVAHIENPIPHLKITACYDNAGIVITNTLMSFEPAKDIKPKFLLGYLNSKFVSWYAYNFIYSQAIRTMDFYDYYIQQIPNPIISIQQQKPFINLVNKILTKKEKNEDTSKEEQLIDLMVYKLYELTLDEVRVVEPAIDEILESFDIKFYDWNNLNMEDINKIDLTWVEVNNMIKHTLKHEFKDLGLSISCEEFVEKNLKLSFENKELLHQYKDTIKDIIFYIVAGTIHFYLKYEYVVDNENLDYDFDDFWELVHKKGNPVYDQSIKDWEKIIGKTLKDKFEDFDTITDYLYMDLEELDQYRNLEQKMEEAIEDFFDDADASEFDSVEEIENHYKWDLEEYYN